MDIKTKLLGEELSDDELKKLPREAHILWLSRPTRDQINDSKGGMYVRVFLIVIAIIYYGNKYHDHVGLTALFLILCGYEFAYFSLRKQVVEKEYREKRYSYILKVEALDE